MILTQGITMLISDEMDFKTKTFRKDKEVYYIMSKRAIHQEDIEL
jgi:hypothetical protein